MKARIEMPAGTKLKMEIDKVTGLLHVDRVLSIPCPHAYGYLEGTLAPDGDALDVFVISNEYLLPNTTVDIIPFAVLHCRDAGIRDDKILATVKGEPLLRQVRDQAASKVWLYLEAYKAGFVVRSYESVDASADTITVALLAYQGAHNE